MFPEKAEILFNNSFPSGHTAAAFLMFCLFSLFSNKKNIFLDIMFFILALMVGWSRIYLGAHFFEDVASGSIFGVIIATVVYLSYKNIVTKR